MKKTVKIIMAGHFRDLALEISRINCITFIGSATDQIIKILYILQDNQTNRLTEQ